MDFGVFSLRGYPRDGLGHPRRPPGRQGRILGGFWVLQASLGAPWTLLWVRFSALGATKRRPRSAPRPRRGGAALLGRQGALQTGVLVPKPQ